MRVEDELQKIVSDEQGGGESRRRQMADFQKFEERLSRGGYIIEKQRFSIPLMERLGCSYVRR